MPVKRGRVQLAYGYAMTIHTAQGSDKWERITALPSGSQAIDGLLAYSSNTRHIHRGYMVTSESAEQAEVRKRRALNDTRPIALDDKWAQVARVLSYQPERDSATSMLERVATLRRGTVRAFQDLAEQRLNNSRSIGPDAALRQMQERGLGNEIRLVIRQTVEQVRHVVERVQTWRHNQGPSLSR
jgi:hypothetical protein